jgi:nucleoside-diphosphate-sugar epimerase
MEAKHRLIPYLINGIKNNEKMQFTSGKQIRQYLYSGDVPEIVFSLLPLIDNGIYNLSGVETFSVRQIIENVFMFYNLQINEELFGKAERVDSGMQNLQLDGSVVQQKLPNFRYTKFLESLKLYDKCL